MKQKKRGKICFVIHIAGFFFLNFFCYEVFAKQKKPELADNYYSGRTHTDSSKPIVSNPSDLKYESMVLCRALGDDGLP